MLYIEKTTDKNYPFTIHGSWNDKVYTTEKELRKLAETIIEMFGKGENTNENDNK